MRRVTFGKTDLEVSPVCFGCWAIVGGFNWGDQDVSDSIAAMQAAFDGGINFFDTAEGYGGGDSEKLLARGLGDHRDEIVIASKASPNHFEPPKLRTACERSLKNLQTDRIDLYQLHWPNWDVPVADAVGMLEELKSEGKIRHYGVSNFGPQDLAEILEEGPVVSNQVAYSLLFRAIEYAIAPLCVEKGLSILPYSPLLQGLLTGKFATPDEVPAERRRTRHYRSEGNPDARHGEEGHEAETFAAIDALGIVAGRTGLPLSELSLAWLLTQPGVDCVIAGARNARQAEANCRAAAVELDSETIEALSAATDPLKQSMGPNPDMWQPVERARIR